jgi:hypothetical protein
VPGRTFDGVTRREVFRHEARVRGPAPGRRVPYRVVSFDEEGEAAVSEVFTLAAQPRRGQDQKILLTSDHQGREMTPANLQKVEETVGRVDAVFMAGDLVNIPDRASEWFDDARGGAFFPALQGRVARPITHDGVTTTYAGGELIQHAPLYTALGNHEVMGRGAAGNLNAQFGQPLPREIGATACEDVRDRRERERCVTDNSFNSDTYEELFTLPRSRSGGERYWATTVGDVRLVSLYATRIFRTPRFDRDVRGAFREADGSVDDPLEQGYGRFVFEPIAEGSEQYEWLEKELRSSEFRRAEHTVVMLHHPMHTLGDNINPPFTDPVRIEGDG